MYTRHGLTFLTHKTMFNHVMLFELKHLDCMELPMVYILFFMIRVENYALGYDFIMPSSGRALCPHQVEAFRAMSAKPERTSPYMVARVLYGADVGKPHFAVPQVLRVREALAFESRGVFCLGRNPN